MAMQNKEIEKIQGGRYLKSLSVENFRAFEHLEIERLGHVNLIVGRNNIGKTCLLEALWIYASFGNPEVIKQILAARYELAIRVTIENQYFSALWYLIHSYYHYLKPFTRRPPIRIGPIEDNSFFLDIQFMERSLIDQIKQTALSDDYESVNNLARELAAGNTKEALSLLSELAPSRTQNQRERETILGIRDENQARIIDESFEQVIATNLRESPVLFIPATGLTEAMVTQLWNKIYLTKLQDDIESALRILEPKIKNVGLVQSLESDGYQVPQVRMANGEGRVLLGSLGEGMNRIFNLTLALVNVKGGFLLVDEIGSGIHYSVQPKLWDFIFTVAQRLGVQVFATTHSWDAVTAFQEAAQNHPELEGMLVSLRSKKDVPGEVIGTLFNEADLAQITQEQIEVR